MTDKDDNDQSPKGGHPGPVDKGGDGGGMATREQAPELVEETSDEKSDDE